MVYAGLYPEDPEEFLKLKKCVEKLVLTDPAV